MSDFVWCRSTGGYRWTDREGRLVLEQDYVRVRADADGTLRRVVINTQGPPVSPLEFGWRTYSPADVTPPLFRQFAELADADDQVHPDGVLAFARRYGHLTLHCHTVDGLRPADEAEIGPIARPARELIAISAAADAPKWKRRWERLCHIPERADQYSPTLDRENQGVGLGETADLWTRNARAFRKVVELYDGLGKSVPYATGRRHLEAFIREELDGRVRFAITWKGNLGEKATSGHPDLHPQDLLAYIWLQFARQVARAEEYRQCLGCGEYFSSRRRDMTAMQRSSPQPERKVRAGAQFCSEQCYKAHYYRTQTLRARKRQKADSRRSARVNEESHPMTDAE